MASTHNGKTIELRKFCVDQAANLALKAFPNPTITDVINNAKKLEEYINPVEVIELGVIDKLAVEPDEQSP